MKLLKGRASQKLQYVITRRYYSTRRRLVEMRYTFAITNIVEHAVLSNLASLQPPALIDSLLKGRFKGRLLGCWVVYDSSAVLPFVFFCLVIDGV